MHFLHLLRHRLRSIVRRRAVEDDLARELELHLEQLTREHVAQGMSEPDARRAARLEFGSPALATEQCRDARRLGLLEDFVKDSRYSLRLFRRSPGFALTATLSLALGIGANTAIFSSERLLSTLAASFSVLALGLAAIGLYGVLSYSVTGRHVEFGVRMALGASHARIATGVMREVLLQVALGVAIGLPAALTIARAADALLFGVTAGDWTTYLASVVILTTVAAVAAWLPARRAYSIDPVEALRRG